MTGDVDLNLRLVNIQRNFVRKIYFYVILVLALLVVASVLLVRFFSPLVALAIVILVFLLILIIVEIIKSYRLRRLLNFLSELIDNGFHVHAYYLINTLKPYFNAKWLEPLKEEIRILADISSDEELIYNDELYDKELDNIISLIDFNIDIYKDFYLHNKLAVDSYGKQLKKIGSGSNVLDNIYLEQKQLLEVEEKRLEAFEQIKQYFQKLKRDQIKQMFTLPQVIDLEKDYGRFVNNLLDKAVYSAEARAVLAKIMKAKARFYEVFSDILKAKTREEIEEKLNYLFSE